MADMHALPLIGFGALASVEGVACYTRFQDRKSLYADAQARAKATGRKLVVIGDPDGGTHTAILRAYDCGDICLDLGGCPECPTQYAVDLTKGPISEVPADSAVVFVSCVLEYVSDFDAAWAEIMRMAGSTDNVFVVEVQPWTFTAALYPGAKQTLQPLPLASGASRPAFGASPVSTLRKAGSLALPIALLVWGFWP